LPANVDNGFIQEPDSSQLDDSFTFTKRNIEAILGILETSDVEDSLPLRLVNDIEFRNVMMANPSQ
jgi:hypothetical protein